MIVEVIEALDVSSSLSEAFGVLVAPRNSIHYWYWVVSVALDRRVYCVMAENWSFSTVLTNSCMQHLLMHNVDHLKIRLTTDRTRCHLEVLL